MLSRTRTLPQRSIYDLSRGQEINMQCANPKCGCDAPYLRDGSLHLLELEAPANRRLEGDEGGFPRHSSLQRYFWLCGECAKVFSIAKWTPSGVVLPLRKQHTSTIDQESPQVAG